MDDAYSTTCRTIDKYAYSFTDLSQALSVLLSRPSLLLALLQIFVQWLDQRKSRRDRTPRWSCSSVGDGVSEPIELANSLGFLFFIDLHLFRFL